MLSRTTTFFTERGMRSPRLDAEILLAHALSVERIVLYTDGDRPLLPLELDLARALVARRAAREPIAYITGTRSFRRLTLAVSPDVLIPRPETEHLVEWAIALALQGASVLDWGTGSGAVALALANERPDLRVTAIERSAAALAIARANDGLGSGPAFDLHRTSKPPGTAAGVEFLESDGFSGVAGRRFDIIVANPPYLTDAELAATPEAELAFEPAGALASGPTGYEAIDGIITEAPRYLMADGWLVVEVGDTQADSVVARLRRAGYREVSSRRDLAGVERNVAGQAP